jgi:hypothetical protein
MSLWPDCQEEADEAVPLTGGPVTSCCDVTIAHCQVDDKAVPLQWTSH